MRIPKVRERQLEARGKFFRASQITALLVFAATARGTALGATRPPRICPPDGPPAVDVARIPDHFLCHKVQPAMPGLEPGYGEGVLLEDQFSKTSAGTPPTWVAATVRKSRFLCTPANKNNDDPDWTPDAHPDHLRSYAVARPVFAGWTYNKITPTNPVQCVPVTGKNYGVVDPTGAMPGHYDCFGELFVDIPSRRDTMLMVPTAKSLIAPPAAPTNPAVDHFQCYEIKVPRSSPSFKPIHDLRVEDQFGSALYHVTRPARLCAPVNKNVDSDALTHGYHLMCYEIFPDFYPGPIQPIFTNNQFGPQELVARNFSELCVPATKIPGI